MGEKLLTTLEAAEALRLSPRTLERWRWEGVGPPYRKLGGAVRYSAADLEKFLSGAVRASTSNADARASSRTPSPEFENVRGYSSGDSSD